MHTKQRPRMQHAPARLCGGTCTERKEQAATRNVCGKQTLELSQHRCHTVALGTRSLASSTRTPRARIHATTGARRSLAPPGRRPHKDCLRTARKRSSAARNTHRANNQRWRWQRGQRRCAKLTQRCASWDRKAHLRRTSALRRLQEDFLHYEDDSRLAHEVSARRKDQAIDARSSAAKFGFAGLR